MKRINLFAAGLLLLIMASCNETPEAKVDNKALAPAKHGTLMDHHSSADSVIRKFSPDMVANKRDFICGMPVTAGIADTAHYDGKVYGFCATECKAEFLQHPQAYIKVK